MDVGQSFGQSFLIVQMSVVQRLVVHLLGRSVFWSVV